MCILYTSLFEIVQLETSACLFLLSFCLPTRTSTTIYQREANHISQPLRDLLCIGCLSTEGLQNRVKLGGVNFKECTHGFGDAFRL